MTPDDARERIDAIKAAVGDWERTHSEEDDLWEAALESIAEGSCADPAELARVALHSRDLGYTRWYA